MAHNTSKRYQDLRKRLDCLAQGAPESEVLLKILEVLFSPAEARLVSVLPINFFTIRDAARRWGKKENETRVILDTLADKGILLDFQKGDTQAYILAPTMAGFFEFSLMRTDGRFNRKILSTLFYEYINQEKEFIRQVFGLTVPIERVFVHEDMIPEQDRAIVLSYERASHIIDSSTCITVGTCYCRHKMSHLGKACGNPQEVCLTFNKVAESLFRHRIAKKIVKKEAFRIQDEAMRRGLIQLGDNIQNSVNWICNCCGCCCEGLLSYKRLGYQPKIHSNFLATIDKDLCTGCGVCVKHCHVDAVTLPERDAKSKIAAVNWNRCIGCGVCVRFCKAGAVTLVRRDRLNFTPKDTFERYILNAIETGKLQNYLFDNFTLWTHRILREFLGVIASLEPVKKIMALEQLGSRFLRVLARTDQYTLFNRLYNDGRKVDYRHNEIKSKKFLS